MAKQDQVLSYEQAVSRLQEIVAKLEEGDLPLEKSLKLFEEGVGLARQCSRKLDDAQGIVEKLIETPNGTLATEPLQMESLGK